jgi:hypothetical protein
MSEIIIRRSEVRDLTGLMVLLPQWIDEQYITYPPVEPKRLLVWVAETLVAGDVWVAVEKKNNNIVGSLAMTAEQWPWNSQWFLKDQWLFVMSEFRKGGTATKMIELAKRLAIERNVPCCIGVISGKDAELKDRFVAQNGYVYAGGNFIAGLPTEDREAA